MALSKKSAFLFWLFMCSATESLPDNLLAAVEIKNHETGLLQKFAMMHFDHNMPYEHLSTQSVMIRSPNDMFIKLSDSFRIDPDFDPLCGKW